MKIRLLSVSIFFWLFYLNAKAQVNDRSVLAQSILADKSLDTIQVKALKLLSGFSAGTSYSEVWIRDFNTFIKGSLQVHPKEKVKAGQNAVVTFTVDNLDKAKKEMVKKGAKCEGDIIEIPGHVKMQMVIDSDGNRFQMCEMLNA